MDCICIMCLKTYSSLENIFESLTEYKKYITPRLWTKYITSAYEKIEYESINQPFRIVGTRTKGESYTMAFQVGEKVSIEYMNQFVPEDMKLSNVYKSRHSLEEAKKLYPTWYEERIVKGREKGFLIVISLFIIIGSRRY